MIAAARRALGFLTPRERRGYTAFVVARAVLGLFDVAGLALVGVASSSPAFTAADPAGTTVRPGVPEPRSTASSSVLPASRPESPAEASNPNSAERSGRRRSASTTTTDVPVFAIASATLAATVVVP